MRIAFVTQPGHAVLPAAGSIELWAEAVATRLAASHDVTILASRPPRPPGQTENGVAYRFVHHDLGRGATRALRASWRLLPPRRPFFSSAFHPLEYWVRVALEVRRQGIDVVHVFNYSQALPILRRLTRAKLVLHMHCEWLTQLDSRMIERRLRHADLVIGCSDHITGSICRRFPQHASRCITIHNGVEVPESPSRGSDQGRETVRLLNVGRVSAEKGLHVLVDALETLVRDHPEVRLTIVGEESPVPYEFAVKIADDEVVRGLARYYGDSYLRRLRDSMSDEVSRRVTFVDRIPHAQVANHYAQADIFVYPSIFESFAIPPVEAMAAGLPVVASRVGGMKETIVDGVTGLLVEREEPVALASALERLVVDAQLRRSLGEAGRARAASMFGWPRIVAELEAAYAGLTGARAAPADAPGTLVETP